MANHLRTELVFGALNMAIGQRRPEEVAHHSYKGVQYTSLAFGKRWREMGVLTSTGTAGDCYDSAIAESFFATMECKLIEPRAFQIHTGARMAIVEYLEGWYNTRRRHSALGYLSPNDFERATAAVTCREDDGGCYDRAELDNCHIDNPEFQNHSPVSLYPPVTEMTLFPRTIAHPSIGGDSFQLSPETG